MRSSPLGSENFNMISGDADDSEKDRLDSSRSFGSSSSPIRTAKKKIRKKKKLVAGNPIKANSTTSDELTQTKMKEHKIARSKQQEPEGKPRDFSTASGIMDAHLKDTEDTELKISVRTKSEDDSRIFSSALAIMAALSEDIEDMKLETQKILEELQCAKRENKRQHATREGVDEELLAGRITELEVENEILKTRLQSGQGTVDSISADISRMATSNQDCKKALREVKAASRPLQLEKKNLRSKIQQAESDLQPLEAKAKYKRTARTAEINQKEIFELASREILDLQRNYCLKKQISQRKLQQRQQKMKQHHSEQHLQDQIQEKPLKRALKRQSSWWQLDNPEEAPAQAVCAQSVSEDSSIDHSVLDTSFDSSGSAVG